LFDNFRRNRGLLQIATSSRQLQKRSRVFHKHLQDWSDLDSCQSFRSCLS
jgi:hypothetical protein